MDTAVGIAVPTDSAPRTGPVPLTDRPLLSDRAGRLGRRVLPHGVELPPAGWRVRHRAVCAGVVALATVVVVWTALFDRSWHGAVEAAVTLVVAGVALAVPHTRRRLAASAASFALLVATAVLVHLAGGLTEMHFLFFIIVAAVTLYQQWAPFLTAVVFVAVHHGVLGTVMPASIYSHPAAVEHPWLWAGIHAGFIALASTVGLAAWRFDELVREELREAGEHHRLVLDSVGDAVLAIDAAGGVVSANSGAAALLRRGADEVLGRHVHDAVHPHAPHPATRCPLALPSVHGPSGGLDAVHVGRSGSAHVPVRYRLSPVQSHAAAHAVLTLTDVSVDQRAHLAEMQLRHLSAERRAERAEVEQLVASVTPSPLVVAGAEIAATYRPASRSLIGGDLYDWFTDPEGVVHVAVIDAMGKGVSATQQAVAVMHALRVLALEGRALDGLLARADEVLSRHDPELAASAVLARYHPSTGVLRLASAGHPPALVVRSDGSCEYLETVGVGIGFPQAGSSVLAEVALAPGDAVVLYTDGLIEGTRDIDRGLADLAGTAAGLTSCPVELMSARLVDEPGSVSADDDRVAVVLRRRG